MYASILLKHSRRQKRVYVMFFWSVVHRFLSRTQKVHESNRCRSSPWKIYAQLQYVNLLTQLKFNRALKQCNGLIFLLFLFSFWFQTTRLTLLTNIRCKFFATFFADKYCKIHGKVNKRWRRRRMILTIQPRLVHEWESAHKTNAQVGILFWRRHFRYFCCTCELYNLVQILADGPGDIFRCTPAFFPTHFGIDCLYTHRFQMCCTRVPIHYT